MCTTFRRLSASLLFVRLGFFSHSGLCARRLRVYDTEPSHRIRMTLHDVFGVFNCDGSVARASDCVCACVY